MRAFTLLAFAGGLGLFIWLLAQADLGAVAAILGRIGWTGAGTVIAVFAAGFGADVISWLLMFRSIPVDWRWGVRLLAVQMVGEALNVVTPFGSFGGEPVKALLLKRHYRVAYTEGSASLLLIQTVNSLAQVPFLLTAVALLVLRHMLAPAVEHIIVAGATVITLFMLFVLTALHARFLADLRRRLSAGRWGASLHRALTVLEEIEQRLFFFMRESPARFAGSYVMAFTNWLTGAVEMFLLFRFLGFPISFADAWLIEGTVSIARSMSFFVPAHLGVQDGTIALLGQALTGSPEIGIAVALARRVRELAWSGLGLCVGAWFGLRKPVAA
jgi:hypothetical protein